VITHGAVEVNAFQQTSIPNVYCAGETTGVGGAASALIEGQIAGFAATDRTSQARALFGRRAACRRFRTALNRAFELRPELKSLAGGDTMVCRCEDIGHAELSGFDNWRAAKLQTRCGMGPCQGRVCGTATRALFGWEPGSVRPPIFPVRIGALLGVQTSAKLNPDPK